MAKPAEQISFFEEESLESIMNTRRRWEYAFQRWSDRMLQDGTSDCGKCGCGAMCDCCDGYFNSRTCVRALNAWLKERGLKIDYTTATYEDVWRGKCNG